MVYISTIIGTRERFIYQYLRIYFTIIISIKNNYLTYTYNISYVKFNLLRIITLLYTYNISLDISSLKCTTYTCPEIRATLI